MHGPVKALNLAPPPSLFHTAVQNLPPCFTSPEGLTSVNIFNILSLLCYKWANAKLYKYHAFI